jgi:lipopolysaccharide/colanic/teichoic acid biosynthesis glycosyltransferase
MKELILEKTGKEAYEFISKHVALNASETLVVNTTNIFNVLSNKHNARNVVNLSKINNIRFINKFFEKINENCEVGAYFVCCVETITGRRERHKISKIPILNTLYFAIEFLFLRVAPKVWGLKKIYFLVTRGRNRLISKAEALGRLVCCGFDIVDYENYNGLLYIVVKKVKAPDYNSEASYGPLFKMKRMGKNGKIIKVYKFRTMHPYSEYLHDHILKLHGYSETGKPKNDFRLTPWGKTFRKYWIDELPQLLNVLKGDMKLVGVRPISERYFKDIPEEIQQMRLKHKPGCIPPYVSLDRKSSVEDVLQAEKEYMLIKEKNPYTTDTKFFLKAIFNIIFRNKRSA